MKAATKKPARSVRLFKKESKYFGIEIKVKGHASCYVCQEIPAYAGRGFQLEKIGSEEVYHVLAANGQDGRCDCIGHEAHGRCKHLDGLRALIGAGKI